MAGMRELIAKGILEDEQIYPDSGMGLSSIYGRRNPYERPAADMSAMADPRRTGLAAPIIGFMAGSQAKKASQFEEGRNRDIERFELRRQEYSKRMADREMRKLEGEAFGKAMDMVEEQAGSLDIPPGPQRNKFLANIFNKTYRQLGGTSPYDAKFFTFDDKGIAYMRMARMKKNGEMEMIDVAGNKNKKMWQKKGKEWTELSDDIMPLKEAINWKNAQTRARKPAGGGSKSRQDRTIDQLTARLRAINSRMSTVGLGTGELETLRAEERTIKEELNKLQGLEYSASQTQQSPLMRYFGN